MAKKPTSTGDENNNLLLKILKKIQADMSVMKDDMNQLGAAVLTLRLDMHAVRHDIQSARGEVLEAMRSYRRLNTDVERIKAHLDLKDNLDA